MTAADFATTAERAIDAERHAAVRKATALILQGRRGYAQFILTRSVMRQARLAGLGDVDLGVGFSDVVLYAPASHYAPEALYYYDKQADQWRVSASTTTEKETP